MSSTPFDEQFNGGGPSSISATAPAASMAFVTWLDVLERIDMVLLEIIHFQTNIIHGLRTEKLYRILYYEENYLWGTYLPPEHSEEKLPPWFDVLHAFRNSSYKLAHLAGWWVPGFPYSHDVIAPRRTSSANQGSTFDPQQDFEPFFHAKERADALKEIKEIVPTIYELSEWSADARRHYHSLCTLQDIKANIVRDKLVLCLAGHEAFNLFYEGPPNRLQKSLIARLITVRSAVMTRLEERLELVGTLIGQFEKSLDLSLHQDPRPTVKRRREQGFYNSFLSERTLEVQAEFKHLFNMIDRHSKNASRNNENPTGVNPEFRPARVMHSWHHSYTSSTKTFYNEVQETAPLNGKRRQNTDFVNSSFYMPERPDLQTVLSHELAHNVIKRRYQNFYSPPFDVKDDHFARLIKQINMIFTYYNERAHFYSDGTQGVLLEVGTDLLASAVSGPSYLFAAVLELIGGSVEYLFELPSGELPTGNALDMDLALAERVYIPHEVAPIMYRLTWYIRLRILCTWLEGIEPNLRQDPLANTLVKGTRALLEIFIDRVGELLPDQRPRLQYWRDMAGEIDKQLARAPAISVVRGFRRELSNPDSSSSLPRAHRRLPENVRKFLIKELLTMKSGKRRLFHTTDPDSSDTQEKFTRAYLCADGSRRQPRTPELYKELLAKAHDIPWECALINARDYLGALDPAISHPEPDHGLPTNPRAWLESMHHGAAMGKELYQFAFEIAFWRSQSPKDRMGAAIRVVQSALKSEYEPHSRDSIDPDLKAKLENWCHGVGKEDLDRKIEEVKLILARQNAYEQRSGAYGADSYLFLNSVLGSFERLQNTWHVDTEDNELQDILNSRRAYIKEIKALCRKISAIEGGAEIGEWLKNASPRDRDHEIFSIVIAIEEEAGKYGQGFRSEYRQILTMYPAKSIHNAHFSRTASIYPGEPSKLQTQAELWSILRVVDKAEGYKLEDLKNILQESLDKGSLPRGLRELLRYVSLHPRYNDGEAAGQGSSNDSPLLVPFRFETSDEAGTKEPGTGQPETHGADSQKRTIQLFNLSRYGLAEPLKVGGKGSNSALLQLSANSQWHTPGIKADGDGQYGQCRYQTVMGRFDLLSLERCRPLHRGPLPRFKEKDGTDYWIPYFRRQELVIPFRLHHDGRFPKEYEEDYEIYAALPILLTQRTARLPFVYRLWEIAEEQKKAQHKGGRESTPDAGNGNPKPQTLSEVRFSEHDRAMIGEGWGDIIILFGKKRILAEECNGGGARGTQIYRTAVNAEDVEHALDIQSVIYEDFLVDRTELVFFSSALSAAAVDEKQRFKVFIDVRLEEDRKSQHVNESIKAAFHKTAAKNWDAEKLAGPMDFRFTLKRPLSREKREEGTAWLEQDLQGVLRHAEFVSSHVSRKLDVD